MSNLDCQPALLISALNSEDTGTTNILPALWNLPQDIIRAAFGVLWMNTQDTGSRIPPVGTGAIFGSAECKRRCGMSEERSA
jgi:hypothetical protein